MTKRKAMFELPVELLDELKECSEQTDISQVGLIKRGIRLVLDSFKQPAATPAPAVTAAPAPRPAAPAPEQSVEDLIGTRIIEGARWFTMQGACRALSVTRDSVLAEIQPDHQVRWLDEIEWIDQAALTEACSISRHTSKVDQVISWLDLSGRRVAAA